MSWLTPRRTRMRCTAMLERAQLERGQILPRVAVQHQLIGDQLERIPRQRPLLREPVLGHRPGQIPVRKHAALELRADGVTVVQWHGEHLP